MAAGEFLTAHEGRIPIAARLSPLVAAGGLIAGLTVWAVLVPEALAYASIAGVSPVVGLYAAPGALILYAALGSSRQLVVGPMAATAALSAATIAALMPVGSDRFATLTAGLAIATGLSALIAGMLRLGFLASFISESVLKGFIVGLALVIIIGQVPKLLGISKGSGDFFEQLWHVISHLGNTDGLTLMVGVLSLAVIVGLRRYAPALPGSLVAVGLGIVAVEVLGLQHHGVEIVGPIKSGLRSFGIPKIRGSHVGALVAGGVGVMLVGFAEGLAPPRPTRRVNISRLTPTASCSASGAPTSLLHCPAGWSSTAACPRARSTRRRAPAPRCRD